MDGYLLLKYAHLVLFAYWLGPDWGVFVNSRRVGRPGLSKAERLAFLKAAVGIDFFPRSAIVLLIPVGFQLAAMLGISSLTGPWLIAIWAVALTWLLLVWSAYILTRGSPLDQFLQRIHIGLRHVLMIGFIAFGCFSLVVGSPISEVWLAVKLILVGVLLALGSVLRVIVQRWLRELTAGDPLDTSCPVIEQSYPTTRKIAYVFWLTTLTIAFFGLVKPL